MQLLGSTTLAANSNSISVSGLAANVHLFVIANLLATTDPDISYSLRLNRDNGANYRRARNAQTAFTSLELVGGGGGSTLVEATLWLDILNLPTQRKYVSCRSILSNRGGWLEPGAVVGAWNNLIDSVSTVTIGSGQQVLLAGSALWVYGLF
jgi:hypothetical protein